MLQLLTQNARLTRFVTIALLPFLSKKLLHFGLKMLLQFALILHFALVATFLRLLRFCVSCYILRRDTLHLRDRRGWRVPQVWVSGVFGTLPPRRKTCFNFNLQRISSMTPQNVCEGMQDNTWNLPFLWIRKPKVNYADIKCALSSLNLIISQLAEKNLRIIW